MFVFCSVGEEWPVLLVSKRLYQSSADVTRQTHQHCFRATKSNRSIETIRLLPGYRAYAPLAGIADGDVAGSPRCDHPS